MNDLISRQAAIEAFDGHFVIVGRNSTERFKMYIESVINDIRKLPPAQPEPCEDAVSREALAEFINNASVWVTYKQGDSQADEAEFVESIIKQTKKAIISMVKLDMPSVTPKQRTGKWIKADVCGDITSWECSCCHNWTGLPKRWDVNKKLWFCPKCGMKMEGEHNG